MAKISTMTESKYLKQSDVEDEMVVTIAKIGKANIAKEGDEAEYKWLCRFNEFTKPMVLNATNIKRLARACSSDETDDWIGKKVMLYVDHDVEYAGQVVGGLRIRPISRRDPIDTPTTRVPAGNDGGADIDNDIPF